ncbi:MAG TPA: DNA helicase [Candidatus Competibacteraceae bacterium]|nr:DNA helicase [Candidatus Competibacteraceae bacterium]
MDQESVVRYWHAVELLQPQAAPKLARRTSVQAAFFHDTSLRHPVPAWAPESLVARQALPKKRIWSHTLYAHLYDSRCIADRLKKVFGADQGYREPQRRQSALFAAKFGANGHLVDDSFTLSSEAWFLGRVLAGADWARGFDEDQNLLRDRIAPLMGGRVSGDTLRELTWKVLGFLNVADFFGDMNRRQLRFRSQPVNPDKIEPEDDPFNSFLLSDLADVADRISQGVSSPPLDRYLSEHDPQARLHMDGDRASPALIDRLMPDAYADGCWPSERHLGLVHSQQLAVNTALATLGEGGGLLGVNGPPGTGKTTLLRDLIAAIVVRRADALAKLPRASSAFAGGGPETANDGGKPQSFHRLDPGLYGFEIVVASSNNGAVENVTLELPQRDKIDESWLPEAEHFAELGALIAGKPAWGLISGALGSKARRTRFVDRYFYGRRPSGALDQADGAPDGEADPDARDGASGDGANGGLAPPPPPASGDGVGRGGHRAAPSEKEIEKNPQGLRDWLNERAKVNDSRTPEQRKALWRQAVAEYETAKAEARRAWSGAARIREWIQALERANREKLEKTERLRALERESADAVGRLVRLDAEEGRPAREALQRCVEALQGHQARKPGLRANLFSVWGAWRAWKAMRELLESQHALAKFEFERLARLVGQLDAARAASQERMTETHRELQRLEERIRTLRQDAEKLAETHRADHLLTWLHEGVIGRGDAVELAEPWRVDGWRQARARVFIRALKLHQTFFELEALRLSSNLRSINALLAGTRFRGVSRDAIRSVWASLFMVVPVLSSTFASFSRSFGTLGAGEIGWLLADEAGQASPQAAVGALWRSRRALTVGDPMQLKPIVTVSDAVLEHMRTRYRVDARWLPNRQSAQTLADDATPWGRMAGPAGHKTWVGLPLVVHRRCDKPMHQLANRIAYDGAMVYGTIAPPPERETRASLPTGWVQARGPSEGNWVPAEGQALLELLAALYEDGVEGKDISVITPFKDVRKRLGELKRIPASGTIHTMQGKESPVVILVLGGNTDQPGARDWAVSEPNLLNVAATRAKRRFYVIGDRRDWRDRALFCEVMDLLPLLRVPARGQGPTSPL